MEGIVLLEGFLLALSIGALEGGNILSLSVFSRSLPLIRSLVIGSSGLFLGTFLLGERLTHLVAEGLVVFPPEPFLILPVLLSTLLWRVAGYYLRVPVSFSHSLLGGIIGGVLGAGKGGRLIFQGIIKYILYLALAPLFAFVLGILLMGLLIFISSFFTPGMRKLFRKGQNFTLFFLSLAQGSNDGQKLMGIILLFFLLSGYSSLPLYAYVILLGLPLGVWLGSGRIMKATGKGIFRVEDFHAFLAQGTAFLVTLFSTLLGGPVSSTQVLLSTMVGAGFAYRPRKVRWSMVKLIAISWILTIPVSGIISFVLVKLWLKI